MNRFFSRVLLTLACTLSLGLPGLASPVYAQTTPATTGAADVAGLDQVAAVTSLTAADPRTIAVRIINVVLSLLAIIMVGLMLYAGFLWMTAGGNQEQIERAKKVIRNAIIGSIIIVSSWGITRFILSALTDSTGGGGGGAATDTGGTGFGGGLGSGGSFSSFQLQSINPTGEVPLRNVEVRFLFTQEVDPALVPANLKVARADGTVVDGRWQIEGTSVTFIPRAACPAPSTDRFCFAGDTDFVATVASAFRSATGQRIGCGGLAPVCEARFHTGDEVDTDGPDVFIMSPFEGEAVPVNDLVTIETLADDPSGISQIQTLVDGRLIGRDAPTASSTPASFSGRVFWDTHGVTLGTHKIDAIAFDTDSNRSSAVSVNVVVRAATAFDGVRDGDETGVDCGGSSGTCSGGACTVSSACASSVCSAGICVERPIITSVSPNDGQPGTIVTIAGANFGTTPGVVTFAGNHEAHFPVQCTAGTGGWSDDQIVIEVPAGAVNGPITVKNAVSGLVDSTSDSTGPRVPDFSITTTAHPGLCAVEPGHGDIGQAIRVSGAGLGSSADRVLFNDSTITTFREWSDTAVGLNVPVQTPGSATIQAQVGTAVSNPVSFSVDERASLEPALIESLSPNHGPVGQYITIRGRHFGDRAGLVRFRSAAGREGNADTDFPDACDLGTRYWSDTAVVFKVPATIAGGGLVAEAVAAGAYEVYLQPQGGGAASNRVAFTVASGEPEPGICALEPDTGPTGTEVKIVGERLGSTTGQVRFQGASPTTPVLASEILEWSSQTVRVRVPSGAKTGMTSLGVGTQSSNELPFTVKNCNESADICSSTERCCGGSGICVPLSGGVCPATSLSAHYAWRLSTGELALNPEVVEECNPASRLVSSPSPWNGRAGGAQACVNADLTIRFTTQLSPTTINASNFEVRQCASETGDCSTGTLVPIASGFPRLESATTDTDLVRIRPAATAGRWTPATHYEIFLKTDITSRRGVPMLEQSERCGSGNAYCFRFSTRASSEPCRVGAVLVNPGTYSFADIDETSDYHANPLAQDDECIQLNPEGLPWRWSVENRDGGADGRVLVSHLADSSGELPDQTATARAETTEHDPSLVTASLLDAAAPVSGNGEAFVALLQPHVEAHGPDCDQACVNAGIWARFNVAMLPTSISPANVVLHRCTDEHCTEFDAPFALSADRITLTAAPGSTFAASAPVIRNYLQIDASHGTGASRVSYLLAGQYYQVILRATGATGIRSLRNQPLTELNHPQGFAWTFRTRPDGDGRCAVDRVALAPVEKLESVIGARQRFKAIPYSSPDSCSDTGEALVSDRPYAWSTVHEDGSPDTAVASLVERVTEDESIDDSDAVVRPGMSHSDEQIAEITAATDPPTGETISQTNIQATYEERSGRAVYGLQCGLTSELACRAGYGLTQGGCCSLRPIVTTRYPDIGTVGICRNVEISANFNIALDAGSVPQNVILAERVAGGGCAEGTTLLANGDLSEPTSWLASIWTRVARFFRPDSAIADSWCVGAVSGQADVIPQGTGSRVVFRIQSALKPSTEYRVFLRGEDDITTTTRRGILSARGVKMLSESREWTFRTGTSICAANRIVLEDTNATSPFFFSKQPETHPFVASVQSLSTGGATPVPITPVREYDWSWGPWLSSAETILQAVRDPAIRTGNQADVTTQNKNGSSFISARIQITRDDVNSPTTSGTVIETARNANVMLCERPWPDLAHAPFTDTAGSRSLPSIFAAGPFYNFSTMYCLDAGDPGEAGDLPALHLNPVPLTSLDRDSGILRQYLFTFDDASFRSDGIGIRIAANPFHLSAAGWYAARGFSGSPQATTVDGYDAVRDGATTYISVSNTDGLTSGNVSSTIYVLSYNPNAKPETIEIAKQMLAELTFNVNLSQETHNHCVAPPATPGADSPIFIVNNAAVSCSADWECALNGHEELHCASAKAKLQRDRRRISDMQGMTRTLEASRTQAGRYPALASGSFIEGISTSRWPSWSQSFSQELGGTFPQDPVNRFMACGRCKAGTVLGKACSETSDCNPSETCVAEMGVGAERDGFEPATCWNPGTQHFFCPALTTPTGTVLQESHVYQYRALDNGARYEVALNLEGPAANRYRPALLQEVRRCSNKDQICTVDQDCRILNLDGTTRSTGTCAPTGGRWVYDEACRNVDYARSSSCGGSVLGIGQVCRSGQTQTVSCTASGGVAGTKIQICSDCRAFVDGPATVCTPSVQCGNGRVDAGEACDDGSNNGRYGYCARNCQGLTGYCGDGVVAAGEVCDNGATASSRVTSAPGINGQYCGAGCNAAQSCSVDCRAQAPRCGDGRVDAEEQCDGNVETTSAAVDGLRACSTVPISLCAGGARNGQTCTQDTECGTGGRCVNYPTAHVRVCLPPGSTNQCRFDGWSSCRPIGTCGDGVVNPGSGEQCDDGATGNSGRGRCTPQCRLNVCGDAYMQDSVEECDNGSRNGLPPRDLVYGTPTPTCTTQCRVVSVSGGYCGNGIREEGETCDGTQLPRGASCTTLGFDYADQVQGSTDVLTCTNRCQIAGCHVCTERLAPTAENTITGHILDAVLQNIRLPNALVSLRYNNADIAQTHTDSDGTFTFSGLHTNEACGNYTLVIALQGVRLNRLTEPPRLETTSDPQQGYVSYTTQSFSKDTFLDAIGNDAGDIYLMPHVGDGETLVVRQWNNGGALHGYAWNQQVDPQLLLPQAMGYTPMPPSPLSTATISRCTWGGSVDRAGCQRTINFSQYTAGGRYGRNNLELDPHARLYCYEEGGGNTCTTMQSRVESIFYKRYDPRPGKYRYFLVDFLRETAETHDEYTIQSTQAKNRIRVLWRDQDGREQYAEFTPPAVSYPVDYANPFKYWYVFDQDAVTGQLTPVNQLMSDWHTSEAPDVPICRLGTGRYFNFVDDSGVSTCPMNVLTEVRQ